MAGMAAFCKSVVIIIVFNVILVESSKLNVPRVLLPLFREFSTNYTLEVTEGGCYKWALNRYDIISVTPLDVDPVLGCSSRAVVSTKTKDLKRDAVMVLAEEVHSKQVLRCNVIVAEIVTLNVVTKTRELFMEEAPEIFEVRAYDDQDNEFSTLEGVEFQWSLGGLSTTTQYTPTSNVLRLITFRESPYEIPESVAHLERSGKRGNLALLEGVKTGSAKVSVRLPHHEYRHVSTIEVQLMVLANLFVEPSDVHILQGCTVQFYLKQIQNGHLEEIPLPSAQYFLEMVDNSIGEINEAGIAKGLELGKTKVVLRDRYITEDTGIKMPSASFTVANPYYISLNVLPDFSWTLMMSRKYEIVVEVYDSNDRKLRIDEHVEMSVDIPSSYFHTQQKTRNNTHHYGWPVTVGETTVKAKLVEVKSRFAKPFSILPTTEERMTIVEKITLNPNEIVLPWDPIVRPKYEVKLEAKGGDGNFVWSSSDTSVAIMTQSGKLTTLSHGTANIAVSMARNPYNKEFCTVYIVPPTRLEIINYMMEAQLLEPIYIQVALYAEIPNRKHTLLVEKQMVYMCNDIPFTVKVWDSDFIYNSTLNAKPFGKACATLAIVGKKVGTSKVTISYTRDDGHTMEDSVVVATYNPLKCLHPESRETVLALGTSRIIAFQGGPRPWSGHLPENHRKYINLTGSTEAVLYSEVVDNQQDMYVYRVFCHEIGEVEFRLSISNIPNTEDCQSSLSEATLTVYCAKPRYVSLYTELKATSREACPINRNVEKVVAQNYKDINVTVTVKDMERRSFDNVTSLLFSWDLSHPYLANITSKESVIAETIHDNNLVLPLYHYQIVQPSGQTGQLLLKVSINNYNEEMLSEMEITPESPPFFIRDSNAFKQKPDIRTALTIILVNDTVIIPNNSVVFNHPENKIQLHVNQGSGYYEFQASSSEFADYRYFENNRIIEITPKNDGLLKLRAIDLCLPSNPAHADVSIISLGNMKVDVPSKVELGKQVTATVHFYDTADNLLVIPDVTLLKLRPYSDSPIIKINSKPLEKDDKEKHTSSFKFTVHGMELGETALTFVAQQPYHEIRSAPVTIHVFPPLRLHPRNLTLLIGSVFQVKPYGGPQPDCSFEYSVNSGIASVMPGGVVTAVTRGAAKLTAKAVGSGKNGQKITYSQDSIDIEVLPLRGIKIHAPVFSIRTGCTMPVYASPLPDSISTLILGSVEPHILYSWAVTPRDVAEIHDVFYNIGIDVHSKDKISVRFTALKSGYVTISLNASVPSALTSNLKLTDSTFTLFTDSIDIKVFEGVYITKPVQDYKDQSPLVIMSPHAEQRLYTNLDGVAKLTYMPKGHNVVVPSDNVTSKAVGTATGDIISVDQFGIIKSYGVTGQSTVTVTTHEDFGLKQSISVTVMVKQVWYIMVNIRSKYRVGKGKTLNALPKGLQVELCVSYHDYEGQVFSSTVSQLKTRANRPDLVDIRPSVDNFTVFANLLNYGNAIVKLWDEKVAHRAADYVKFSIGDVIKPSQDHLTVGDIVCYSTPLVDEDGSTGIWDSSDSAIVRIDPRLGIAEVHSTGAVSLTHTIGGEVIAKLEVKVLPIKSITFLQVGNLHISNSDTNVLYDIPILFSSSVDQIKESNSLGCKEVDSFIDVNTDHFSCDFKFKKNDMLFDVSELFVIYESFDNSTGNYVCRIQSSGPQLLNKSVIQSDFVLQVTSGKVSSLPFTVLFVPAFYLHSKELSLSDTQVADKIKISGRSDVLAQIQVRAGDPRLLAVGEVESLSPTDVEYRVYLENYYWTLGELSTRLNIIIMSELTHQRIEVPVKVRLTGKFSAPGCMVSHFKTWGDLIEYYRHIIGLFVAAVALVFFTIFVYNYLNPNFSYGGNLRPQLANVPYSPPGRYSPQNVEPLRSPFNETQPIYGSPNIPPRTTPLIGGLRTPGITRRRVLS